eukprot:914942_1
MNFEQQLKFNSYLLDHFVRVYDNDEAMHEYRVHKALTFNFLYRADAQIYDGETLRSHCNEKDNLLILLKADQNIVFGAYSSLKRQEMNPYSPSIWLRHLNDIHSIITQRQQLSNNTVMKYWDVYGLYQLIIF